MRPVRIAVALVRIAVALVRIAVALACLLGAALALSACGVGVDGADRSTPAGTPQAAQRPALINRPVGSILIDGQSQTSLTPAAVAAYDRKGHRGTSITVRHDGVSSAFAAFCRGQVDLVDSTAPISDAEYQVCRTEGVKPVQLQVASDAIVLATRNESDVGVDCLTLRQVRQIFVAGSQINDWRQLDGYRVPLHVVGPSPSNDAFPFFATAVLGSPKPSLPDLRSDYRPLPSDGAVRLAVAGTDRDVQLAGSATQASNGLIALRRSLARAQGYARSASRQVAKGIRDGRPPAARAHDLASLATAQQNLGALRREVPAAVRSASRSAAAERRLHARRGVLGYFQFRYYEAFEEQLRPIEIDSGADRPRLNCIFPSAQTVTSAQYPLAHRLLITVSARELHRRPDVLGFLRFYVGSVENLTNDTLLLPIPADIRATELGWLDGRLVAPVVYYPSSTVRSATGG